MKLARWLTYKVNWVWGGLQRNSKGSLVGFSLADHRVAIGLVSAPWTENTCPLWPWVPSTFSTMDSEAKPPWHTEVMSVLGLTACHIQACDDFVYGCDANKTWLRLKCQMKGEQTGTPFVKVTSSQETVSEMFWPIPPAVFLPTNSVWEVTGAFSHVQFCTCTWGFPFHDTLYFYRHVLLFLLIYVFHSYSCYFADSDKKKHYAILKYDLLQINLSNSI